MHLALCQWKFETMGNKSNFLQRQTETESESDQTRPEEQPENPQSGPTDPQVIPSALMTNNTHSAEQKANMVPPCTTPQTGLVPYIQYTATSSWSYLFTCLCSVLCELLSGCFQASLELSVEETCIVIRPEGDSNGKSHVCKGHCFNHMIRKMAAVITHPNTQTHGFA